MKYSQPFQASQYGTGPSSRIHCHSPKPALVHTTEAIYPLPNQSSNFSIDNYSTFPQSALRSRRPEQASSPSDSFQCALFELSGYPRTDSPVLCSAPNFSLRELKCNEGVAAEGYR